MANIISRLQEDIYGKLCSLGIAVFDSVVKAGSKLPYLVLGEVFGGDNSTKSFLGHELVVTVHVFSSYKGMKEAKDIADRVIAVLHGLKIRDGFVWFDSCRFFEDEAGNIMHGVIQFRARIFEK